MSTTREPAAAAAPRTRLGRTASYLDDRLGLGKLGKASLRKVFPDHWSFMLGEVALYNFIILLITGVFLTLWFKPSMNEIIYQGSYLPLQGVRMSQAYASTLDISFDVRGGLVIRQIHHWAALLFVASMSVHMLRTFLTGAFRRPRELTWVLGALLLVLGILEGFAGYSLPDDLLSGTGLRIAEGLMLSIPIIGSYITFFLFGGEFPGEDFIPRLYTVHVLLVPGLILALIAAHIMLVVYQKHTQFPGPGRTEDNVVGYPLMPIYTAKAGGFFFIVFGLVTLLSAFAQINPIWLYGAYNPSQVTAGAQPDWYMGFLEGALRMMPGWETRWLGFTVPWNILVPGVLLPAVAGLVLISYPFVEGWITGERDREHHLLDRPRNRPVRTALGVGMVTAYLVMFANGSNDILAISFNLSLNAITWAARIAVFVLPPIAFFITKRVCLGLQHHDRELVLHGRESGRIVRLPHGEYVELHEPLDEVARFELTDYETPAPVPAPEPTDSRGLTRRISRADKMRARLSRFFFEDRVTPATPAEVREIEAAEHAEGAGRPVEPTPDGQRALEQAGTSHE